jgi:opacity protein-like surface antigen
MLALSSPALASFQKGSGEVGVGIGVTQLDSNTFDDTGTGFGIRGGYNFSKLFELEGQLSQTSAETNDATLGDMELNSTTMFVNGVFNFHPRPKLVPYALVGIGTTDVEIEVGGSQVDDSATALQFGGGTRFFFGKEQKVAVRVEVAFINEDTFNEDSTHTNFVGGLTWKLGR